MTAPDHPAQSADQRSASLDTWQQGLANGFENPTTLQRQVIGMRNAREIPNALLAAIIDGCRMDLQPRRFQSWDDQGND